MKMLIQFCYLSRTWGPPLGLSPSPAATVSQDLTTYDYIVQEQRKERERKEKRRKVEKVRVLHVADVLSLKYQVCGMLSAVCIKYVALERS